MRCPICQTEFEAASQCVLPFCSERCREIDLGRWLGEHYGMPVVPDPEADELPETMPENTDPAGQEASP